MSDTQPTNAPHLDVLPLVLLPDAVLRKKSQKVTTINDSVITLLHQMHYTMIHAKGIGLAAPQVNILKRLVAIDLQDRDDQKDARPQFLINPTIIAVSDDEEEAEEGCLSIPQQNAMVTRPYAVEACYIDTNGKEHRLEADGLYARCLQHEIDHLDGKLFIDHLSRLRRSLMTKRAAQIKKEFT